MWKNKKSQLFEDGEIIKYYFANNNSITILTKKKLNQYCCDISWNFGNYFKNIDFEIEKNILTDWDKKNKIKLKELYNIYNSLKKHKYKTSEKILLISALMIVIHDIKENTYIQQNLF